MRPTPRSSPPPLMSLVIQKPKAPQRSTQRPPHGTCYPPLMSLKPTRPTNRRPLAPKVKSPKFIRSLPPTRCGQTLARRPTPSSSPRYIFSASDRKRPVTRSVTMAKSNPIAPTLAHTVPIIPVNPTKVQIISIDHSDKEEDIGHDDVEKLDIDHDDITDSYGDPASHDTDSLNF